MDIVDGKYVDVTQVIIDKSKAWAKTVIPKEWQ